MRCSKRLDRLEVDTLPRDWQPVADWFRAMVLIRTGHAGDAIAIAERTAARAPEFFAAQSAPYVARWIAGEPDLRARANDPWHVEAVGVPVTARDEVLALAFEGAARAYIGDDSAAVRAMIDRARSLGTSLAGDAVGIVPLLASAVLAITEDRDADARATLGDALARYDPATPAVDRLLRLAFAVVYVLVPEQRARWDALELGPDLAGARDLGRQFLAARDGGAVIEVPAPMSVLVQLPLPWACEFAAAAAARDVAGAGALVDTLLEVGGQQARARWRALAVGAPGDARASARAVLASRPVPPSAPLALRVLGPTELRRGGALVDDPDWRRERVRSLLARLVAEGDVRREAAADTLWPDLDERAAAHNLSVTLNYLHGVLEPELSSRDAPYFVAQSGASLRLHRRPELAVDAWELEARLDAAAAAGAAGTPSVALDELLAATTLWRGDYLADWPYEDWAIRRRDQLRARVVAGAVRAAELLVARGDHALGDLERAIEVASLAIGIESWSEPSYRALAEAYVATARPRGRVADPRVVRDGACRARGGARCGHSAAPGTDRRPRLISR